MFKRHQLWKIAALLLFCATSASAASESSRPRARNLGVVVGILPPGPLNAITDVPGYRTRLPIKKVAFSVRGLG